MDANILIIAYNQDFNPDENPDNFWNWLNNLCKNKKLVIPQSVFEEIEAGSDDLYPFLKGLPDIVEEPTTNAFILLPKVMQAYGVLTESDLEMLELGADPYLIAHALDLAATVVSNEISRPKVTSPKNKQIPDICKKLGISCVSYPRFLWDVLNIQPRQ